MQKYFFFFLFFTFSKYSNLYSQIPKWVNTIGSSGRDEPNSICIDNSGNIYVTGHFSNTVDFDPGIGVSNLTSNGQLDIFVAKYTNSGVFLWAINMGGTLIDAANEIKVNNAGEVIITGYFRGTVDFDPSPSVSNLIGVSNAGIDPGFGGDLFLAKYSANGNFLWAFSVPNTYHQNAGYGFDIDDSDNIYITGQNNSTSPIIADFDPGPGVYSLCNPTDGHIFVAKYSTTGNFVWAFALGAWGSNSSGYKLRVDPNDTTFVVTGHLLGTNVDFDPNAGTYLMSSNFNDIFVAKYSLNKTFMWAFNTGGAGVDMGGMLDIDNNSNIYLTGLFNGSNVDFDPSPSISYLSANGMYDVFVAKYTKNGSYIWANSFGSTGDDIGWGVETFDNSLIVTGEFKNTVDFDPGPAVFNLTSAGNSDAFIVLFDTSGIFQCASNFGGVGNDRIFYMQRSYSDTILVTGHYQSNNIDFDPSNNNLIKTNAGNSDIFFGKYYFQSNTNYTATITGDTLCSGENPILNLNLSPNFIGTFSVTISDGINTYTINNVSDNVPFILNATPGITTTYTVQYISNLNPTSCNIGNIPLNLPVTVIVFPATNIIASANPPTICSGVQTTLTASGGVTYNWSGGIINGVAFIPLTTSTYTVIGIDANGCSNTSAVTVTVNQTNPITVIPSNVSICLGDSIQLVASGALNYTWANTPGLNTYTGSSVWAYPVLSSTYTVTGTDANGCTGTSSVFISISSGIDVQVTKNKDAECNINIVQLQASGAQNYTWSPANLVNTPTGSLVNATVLQTTTFYVTGNTGSCVDIDSITVYYFNNDETGIIIPNVFSPNNDGLNDCLKVIQNARFTDYYFTIYNRWGEKVFETDDPNACWNGEHKNQPAEMGTYGYFLKAETSCGKIFKKGDITLLR